MADEIRVVTQVERQAPDDAGRFRKVIETTFYVGKDGPFKVDQDETTFDPAVQRAMIEAKAALVRGVRG
ncbi:MAG: hypothetical protein LAO77_23180 [Acidobacteriia bacterium]|nr:hypothetical protein [Terriglobia bacterium]